MADMPDYPEWDDRDHDDFNLVLPFVSVESVGGPYHDSSFTAGFQVGEICGELKTRNIVATTYLILSPLHVQADLIGMKYGYKSDILHDDGEWTQIGFTRIDDWTIGESNG